MPVAPGEFELIPGADEREVFRNTPDQVKNDLVATASHELKTPLTSIRLAIHLLLEEAVGPLTTKQTELLLDARDNAERLLAEWQRDWPFDGIQLLAHRWAEPDMEDVFTAYSQGYDAMLNQEALQ